MQCPEFEQRLQLAADLRQDPPVDAEFDLHAALCADCSAKRDWFVALAKMTGAFRKTPGLAATDGSASVATYDRVRLIRDTWSRSSQEEIRLAPTPVAEEPVTRVPVASEPVVLARSATPPVASSLIEPPRRRSRLLLAGSGLAVAASIALFVTLALLPPPQPVGGEVANAAPAVVETTAPEDALPPAPTVAEAGPANPAAPGNAFMLSGVDGTLSLEQLRERLSSLPSDPSMTGSLRPITSSFGVAWETLRSALPAGHGATERALDQADVRDAGLFAVA